jgi:hypothetical protein
MQRIQLPNVSDSSDAAEQLLNFQSAHNSHSKDSENNKTIPIKYTKLNDLKFIEDKAKNSWNVYGVATDFQPPVPSHGKDYYCTVTLADETQNGFRVRMFGPSKALPTTCTAGDILRIHNIRTTLFQERPLHGTCLLPRLGSCVVFTTQQSDECLCVSWRSVGSPPVVESDTKRAQELRLWWRQIGHRNLIVPPRSQRQQQSHFFPTAEEVTLAMVQASRYYDIVFKILLKTVMGTKQKLLVWDGTGDRVSSLPWGDTRMNDPLTAAYYIQRLHNLPPFGRILPVIVWSHAARYFTSDCLGKWVQCTMLKASVYRNEIELNTTDRTQVHFLEESDAKVQTRLREIEKRSRKEKFSPVSSLLNAFSIDTINDPNKMNSHPVNGERNVISVVHYEHIPFSTIREVLSHPEPVAKFRLRVSVIQYTPTNIKDFTIPYCHFCKLCIPRDYSSTNTLICPNRTKVKVEERKESETSSLTGHINKKTLFLDDERNGSNQNATELPTHLCGFVYFVRLRVKDSTGEMTLIIFDDDGQQFFFGIPATDLYKNNISLAQIQERMTRLLNPNNEMDCCVKSYYVDKARPNDRRYRVFGTELL